MDIVNINRSIFWATIFSLFIVLVVLIIGYSSGWECQFGVEAILLLLLSVLIIVLMLCMIKILGNQIAELLVLMFDEYVEKEEEEQRKTKNAKLNK